MANHCFPKHLKESRIATKTRLCQEIEHMTQEECHMVLQWYGNEFGCQNINQFLIKLLFVKTNNELFTNISLNNLNQQMKNYLLSPSTNSKTVETQSKVAMTHNDDTSTNTYDTNLIKLMDLPVVVVSHITYFMSKNTIEILQHCNRILYQTINNISYLDKHKELKKDFVLDQHMVVDIVDNKRDMFRFSRIQKLELAMDYKDIIGDDAEPGDEWMNLMANYVTKFVQLSQAEEYYSSWFIELLKSIEILHVKYYGSYFLSLLPIDILFNLDNIHLKRIQCTDIKQLSADIPENNHCASIADFEKKYLECVNYRSQSGVDMNNRYHHPDHGQVAKIQGININNNKSSSEKPNNTNSFKAGQSLYESQCSLNGKQIELVKFGLTAADLNTTKRNCIFWPRQVKYNKYYPFIYSLNMSHLWIVNGAILYNFWDYKHKYHPNLTKLTLEGDCEMYGMCSGTAGRIPACPIDIKRLRLIRFLPQNIKKNTWLYRKHTGSDSIGTEFRLPAKLQWHQSLECFTIHLAITHSENSIRRNWKLALMFVLDKNHFVSLKQLNVLLEYELATTNRDDFGSWIADIFQSPDMIDTIQDSLLNELTIGVKFRQFRSDFVGKNTVGVSMLSLKRKDFYKMNKKMLIDFVEDAKQVAGCVVVNKLSRNQSMFVISNQQMKLFDKLIE